MPPTNKGVTKLLSQAASISKPSDNWDADFDCESDTLFRSSISSVSSTSSVESSNKGTPMLPNAASFATTRAAHKSTAQLLDAFRETDDENDFDMGNTTQKLTKRVQKLSLNRQKSDEKFLQDLEDIDDGSLTLNGSNSPSKQPGFRSGIPIPSNISPSALTGGTIRRLGKKKPSDAEIEDWSSAFSTPKKNQTNYEEDTVATIKAKQYRSGLARNNSLIKGTFFDPPTATLQAKRKSSKRNEPIFDEEDFADGFEGEDLGDVNFDVLKKFQTNQHQPAIDEEDFDKIFDDDNTGITSSSMRESANSSIFSSSTASNTESEVEGDDFLEGIILPENANFGALLKRHHEEAKERELEENPGKYDSIGSNHSDHQIAMPHTPELDFLDGFDLDGGELLKDNTMNTLHRNVKIKGKDGAAKRGESPSKKKRVGFDNMPNLRTGANQGFNRMGSAQPPSTIRMEKLRTKKSMPALKSQPASLTSENIRLMTQGSLPASSNEAIEMAQHARKQQLSTVLEHDRKRVVSSGLRSVQSLSNLKNEPRQKQRSRFSKARTGKVIGDGTELDSFDDLPTNAEHEVSFTVRPTSGRTFKHTQVSTISRKPLEEYKEKPAKEILKKQHRPVYKSTKHRSKNGAKLGLIQQLGPPVSTVVKGYSGNMHFNVKTYTWEGNNEDLKRFDNPSKTPGLIAYISTKGIQIVGDMVFDPAKMKWINLHEHESEEDPFEGVDDLDVTINPGNGVALRFSHGNNSTNNGNGHGVLDSGKRNYTGSTVSTISIMSNTPSKRPSVSTQSGATSNNTDDYAVGKEFELSVDMLRKFRHEESRWEHKVQGWFPPDEAYTREYLGEIRTMVLRQG